MTETRAAGARTLVLLNPEAGGRGDTGAWRERLAALPGAEVAVPASAAALRERVGRAVEEGRTRLVAAGGDGTVHEVVQVLAEAREAPELAIVPLGTANDLARALEIPLDPEEALDGLPDARSEPMDLLEMTALGAEERRWCANVAVGGFGGRVGREVEREEKAHWGSLAYLRSALEELPELPRYGVELEVGEEEDREIEAVNLVVANGPFTGGGIRVAPEARLDDGLLDVTAIPAAGLPRLARLATAALAGRLHRMDGVLALRAEEVVVRSEPPLRFRCDGERALATPVRIRVRPGALRVSRYR